MSFRCQNCNKAQPIGSRPIKTITQTRKRTYHYQDKHGEEKTSEGYEIVKELNLCESCSLLYK